LLLTRYGWQQWVTITVLVALPSAFAFWMHWWVVLGILVVLWLAMVSFFRDPWRKVPNDLPVGTMLSPADGVVSEIEYVENHEATGESSVIIRIFLSVLNVHINRAPCDCKVKKLIYREGKFLDARTKESAKVNESNLLILDTGEDTIGVRQVSGKLARHIVASPRTTLRNDQIRFDNGVDTPETRSSHGASGCRGQGSCWNYSDCGAGGFLVDSVSSQIDLSNLTNGSESPVRLSRVSRPRTTISTSCNWCPMYARRNAYVPPSLS